MDYITVGLVLAGFVTQALMFLAYVKFELKQLRKDMEGNDMAIESKREANVAALKQIYDQKIDASRAYAKNLFDTHHSELKSIQQKISGMESSLKQILDILLKKH